jgi:hypothetical protein
MTVFPDVCVVGSTSDESIDAVGVDVATCESAGAGTDECVAIIVGVEVF